MRQDITFDDYANYRKEYVARARRNFDAHGAGAKDEQEAEEGNFSFAQFRFVISMLLFIGFLYCWYTDTQVFGYSAQTIMEMVADDQYTSLIIKDE